MDAPRTTLPSDFNLDSKARRHTRTESSATLLQDDSNPFPTTKETPIYSDMPYHYAEGSSKEVFEKAPLTEADPDLGHDPTAHNPRISTYSNLGQSASVYPHVRKHIE